MQIIEHTDQHNDAIAPTVRVTNEVSADFFDDKVRVMGHVKVSNGTITARLDSFPSMVSSNVTGDFIAASIALAISACWKAQPTAFERTC